MTPEEMANKLYDRTPPSPSDDEDVELDDGADDDVDEDEADDER